MYGMSLGIGGCGFFREPKERRIIVNPGENFYGVFLWFGDMNRLISPVPCIVPHIDFLPRSGEDYKYAGCYYALT